LNAYPSSSRKPHKESQLRENHTTNRARAEALFKKEKQMREGAKAMAEYEVAQQAMRERTARLRALRLARDAGKQSSLPRKSETKSCNTNSDIEARLAAQ
jgi:multidrug efflux pump subunit AcrA (membrane-fusion protein)